MLDLPLATAEFVALDTETNGLGGERCELTEVGAVLVGGGELHEEWESLVGVANPLGRYIQRFTGISQAMVDTAPAPEDVLPRLAAQLRGPRARRPQRALRRARAAPGVRARGARMAGPAGDLHGPARAPVRAAAATTRAGHARGRARDRRRRGAPRAAGRAHVRARVLRAVRAAVRERADDRGRAHAARRAQGARPAGVRAAPAARRAAAPGRAPARARRVRVPRRRRAPAVRRQVDRPAHARALALHVRRGVDRRGRARRPPDDRVRARRAAARGPADQGAAPARQRARQGRAGRLRLHPLPAGHRVPDPRGRARAGRGPRRLRRSGARPRRRRPSWSSSSTRCSGCATAGGRCRGASTRRPTGRWAAACRRACTTSTRTSTASGWTRRCGCSSAARAARRCSRAWTSRSPRRRRRSATSARPGCSGAATRLESLLGRLGGVLRAIHTGARLVLAPHPEAAGRFDALWIAGGRVVDWGAGRRHAARAALGARVHPRARAGAARRLAAGRRDPGDAARRRLDRGQRAADAGARASHRRGGARSVPSRQAASAASAEPDSSALAMKPRAPQFSKCGG